MADGAGDLAEASERPGSVILARHGRPALSRRRMLSADEYREWWADYEIGGLAEGQTPPEKLKQLAERAAFIIARSRPPRRSPAGAPSPRTRCSSRRRCRRHTGRDG
jgi:hypothetical protein